MLRPYAERFPAHWLVGTLAELTGASLQSVYRVVGFAFVAAAVVATHAAIRTCGSIRARTRSRFPPRRERVPPALRPRRARNGRRRPLLVGLATTLLGFVRGRLALVVGGLVLATLGRQTAVPVAVVAGVWVAVSPAWRTRRVLAVAATLVAPSAVYLLLRTVGASFASPHIGDVHDDDRRLPRLAAEHVARTVLGIAVPAALVLGLWWRTRAHLPRGTLLVAAVIVAQPFVLGPSSAGDNETRLAALALPALAAAAGALLATYG